MMSGFPPAGAFCFRAGTRAKFVDAPLVSTVDDQLQAFDLREVFRQKPSRDIGRPEHKAQTVERS